MFRNADVGIGHDHHRHLMAQGDLVDLVLHRAGIGINENTGTSAHAQGVSISEIQSRISARPSGSGVERPSSGMAMPGSVEPIR